MKARTWIVFLGCLAVLVTCMPLSSQSRPQRPALIRDTDAAEGKEEADVPKEKEYNPVLAAKALQIGDYYFKKKNFDAAIERYLEAMEYQPELAGAYEALGRTFEKKGEMPKALDVYRDFIQKNPTSPKVAEFKTKLAKLEKAVPPK